MAEQIFRGGAASAVAGQALERQALRRAARLLDDAKARPGDAFALGRALRFNLDLWSFLQADARDPQSPLPATLKSQILDLCPFMEQAAGALLVNPGADILQDMIAANQTLAGAAPAAG